MSYKKVEIPKLKAVKIANKGDVATIQIKNSVAGVVLFHGTEPTIPFDLDVGIKLTGTEPFSLGCALTEDVFAVSTEYALIAIQKD